MPNMIETVQMASDTYPPVTLSEADWTRLREAAALYPAVAWIVALLREAVDALEYSDIEGMADDIAKIAYDLPGQCALYGVPGYDWRETAE